MHFQTDSFLSMAVYGQVLQDIPNAEISNDLVSLGNSYFFLLSGNPDVTEPFAYLWRRCCDRKKVANSPETLFLGTSWRMNPLVGVMATRYLKSRTQNTLLGI